MLADLIFIDTETGGFDARTDAILSLAAVPVIAGAVLVDEAREWKIADLGHVSDDALRVNRIELETHLRSADAPGVAARDFNAWAETWFPFSSPVQLAAHQQDFDVRFLRRLWDLAGQHSFAERFGPAPLCTVQLAKQIEAGRGRAFRSRKLVDLCEAYGIALDPTARHSALADAIAGARLLVEMTREAAKPSRDDLAAIRAAAIRSLVTELAARVRAKAKSGSPAHIWETGVGKVVAEALLAGEPARFPGVVLEVHQHIGPPFDTELRIVCAEGAPGLMPGSAVVVETVEGA